MRSLYRSLAVGLALLTAGCFQIEQHITLDRDLSGTADFMMAMDMEVMVPMMASMSRAFSGEQGPPTEEDLAQARRELRESMEADLEEEGPPDLKEIRQDLPEGVRLMDAEFTHEDLLTRTAFNFAFDDLYALTEMSFAEEGEEEKGGMMEEPEKDPTESPFGNLEVIEEGGTLVIRSVNPVAEVGEQQQEMGMGGMMDAMGEAMAEMFQGMRVVFSLEAPFDVVEHNATRVEGNRLVWEYDADDFEGAMEGPTSQDEGIFVRYRR